MKTRFVAVGLNPAVDRTIEAADLKLGGVVRGELAFLEAAGKAMNVARSLAALGHEVTLTGFLGEGELDFFARSLSGSLVEPCFVTVSGVTRQNITITDPKTPASETHVTEAGFCVTADDVKRLSGQLKTLIEADTHVIFSGSLPVGLSLEQYRGILRACSAAGARLVIDTSGQALRQAMRHGVFLVKPNLEELSFLIGKPITSAEDALREPGALLQKTEMVVLSLGVDGAIGIAAGEDGVMSCRAKDAAPPRVSHTVGCGDALLAGFLAGLAEEAGLDGALRLGVACGSVCVGSRWASIRSREEVERQMSHVKVRRLAAGG